MVYGIAYYTITYIGLEWPLRSIIFPVSGLHGTIFPGRQENFTTPRAVVALRFFNCFRLLLEKADDQSELKIYVETLAFKRPGSGSERPLGAA